MPDHTQTHAEDIMRDGSSIGEGGGAVNRTGGGGGGVNGSGRRK